MFRYTAAFMAAVGGGHLPTIKPDEVFNIGEFKVTTTMFSAFVVVVILILAAVIIRVFCIPGWQKSKKVGGFQMLLESLVSMFTSSANELAGHYARFTAPWYFAVAAFILFGTLIEMFVPLRPPVSDLNFALTLGITTFLLIHYYGFRAKKAKRLLHYLNPLNTISELIVPFSMALRMFGSVFSGYLIMHLIYSLPFPILYPALGSVMFTLFHALMQSYIFFMLSLSFIGEAVE